MGKITHDELSDVLNQELQDNVNKIGDLLTLETNNKDDLVSAINENASQ